jgi:hypothetical protein
MAKEIERTKFNFLNSVPPLVEKLKEMTFVADALEKESVDKANSVGDFEAALKATAEAFKDKEGSGKELAIRLNKAEDQMVSDLDSLIAACEKTMAATN